MMPKVQPRLIREYNPSPLLSSPTEMPLCPLQTGSPMTCCKHLSHIGPPWPNGLPGLTGAAQHCQRNEPVRSRVCNPRSTGPAAPPVCWKRWCSRIIVFLWQPNALLTLETLSPRASIVNAWIRWFWFSLGMFNDKRCEIKYVFPCVVGIKIMSIHISCDMYLRLGLHMQIRLYYVLPYKAKISAQHGIGFTLDRSIVYLRLTMPNLQKKSQLFFEIFNIKKCTLFLEPSNNYRNTIYYYYYYYYYWEYL